MFVVAWGERPIELLRSASVRGAAAIELDGSIAVAGAPSAIDGNQRCWISGRLTNARELSERLDLPSDAAAAKIVARAYSRLGQDACQALRGTFIVVAFDRERQVAQVLRDQLGGRPLVQARVRGGVLLAEHERAIIELLPSAPSPDRLALAQWIERGTIPPGRTLFDGIGRIAPAHRAALSAGEVEVERWWRPRYEGIASGSREELAARLREGAFGAVGRASVGAYAPAVLLSGGLDSSCVAAGLAARGGQGKALALSGVFPNHPETDERELIQATARHTGLPVELVAFDESASILEPALEHIERWSLPPATPNLFAWQPLMARARELGVDVTLDGEGGDELFGFAAHLIADMLRGGRALAAWQLTKLIPGIGDEANARVRLRALRLYGVNLLAPETLKRLVRRPREQAADSPTSLLRAGETRALRELDRAGSGPSLDGPLWWRELARLLMLPGEAFAASAHFRRNSIDERIDRRHPFLFDLDLLAMALSCPPRMLFEVRDRALLRDGLEGHIPEAVRTRREKSFFNGLLSTGLINDGTALAEGPARRDAPVRGFVRAEALELLLQEGPAPTGIRAASRLWRVGLADVWLRAFECPGYARELLDRSRSSVLPGQ